MVKHKRKILYSKASLIRFFILAIISAGLFFAATFNADAPRGNDLAYMVVHNDFFHTYYFHNILILASSLTALAAFCSLVHAFLGFYIDTMRKSVREHYEELETKEFHFKIKKH